MRIERNRVTQLTVAIHPYELAGLIAAARWAIEDQSGALPLEAVRNLETVVASYESEVTKL